MAFCSKVGGLLRQSAVRSSASNYAPATHLLNSVRYMSSSKLFVGSLSWSTDELSLKEAFERFGKVTEVRVITDKESGRSRGFAFINFDSEESATSALSGMDGQELQGRNIRVNYATDKPSLSGFDHSERGRFDDSERGRFDDSERGRFDDIERGRFDDSEPGRFDRSERGRFDNSERGRFDHSERGRFDNSERGRFDHSERGRFDHRARGRFDNSERGRFDHSERGKY